MQKWWHTWENVVALIAAGGGAALVLTHVILQANELKEVSSFLDGIGLSGGVGVYAIMGSGLFAALQRQTSYLQKQVHQGNTMIFQGEQAAVKVEEVKEATKEAVKQAVKEELKP
jgi:hypothetical protein